MTGSKQRNNWPTSCGSYATAKPASMSKPSSVGLSAFFGIIIAASLCHGSIAVAPSLPTIKKRPERLHSPRGKELYSATAMAIALPLKSYALVWTYRLPLPRDGVEFDIESRPDFQSPWVKIGTTNQPPYPITTKASSEMFRVGAHKP